MKLPPVPSLALILLWAFGYPLSALAVGAMSPMLVLAIRFSGSAVALFALTVATGRKFPRGRLLAHVAVLGLLTQLAQFGCCYLALDMGAPAVIIALVIALNPVATALLARPILGQRIGPRGWLAVAIGAAAVVSACLPRVLDSPAAMGPALILVLVALLGISIGGIYQQRFCAVADPIASNCVQLGVATIPSGLFAVFTPQEITDPARAAWTMPTMIVLSSMIATTLLLRLVKIAGAAATSMLFAVIPSVSAVMSWALLGQRLDIGIGVGLALGAVALAVSGSATATGRYRSAAIAAKPSADAGAGRW
ncbi:MAG: DMT family transporter [Gordonia sp. (in: high G+C Gram-positive bacteria)]